MNFPFMLGLLPIVRVGKGNRRIQVINKEFLVDKSFICINLLIDWVEVSLKAAEKSDRNPTIEEIKNIY